MPCNFFWSLTVEWKSSKTNERQLRELIQTHHHNYCYYFIIKLTQCFITFFISVKAHTNVARGNVVVTLPFGLTHSVDITWTWQLIHKSTYTKECPQIHLSFLSRDSIMRPYTLYMRHSYHMCLVECFFLPPECNNWTSMKPYMNHR